MLAFFTIAMLHLLGVMTPGPDFALTVKNSLSYPRTVAIYTALGIAIGVSVHTAYCILGLAAIISQSVTVFNIIKFLGAGYLIFIGIKALLAKNSIQSNVIDIDNQHRNNFQGFRQGLLCNLLNPKATLFFLGLFTLVVKPDTPIYIQALYGLEMMVATFLWFSCVALLISHPSVKAKMSRIQHYVTRFLGGFLVAFGLKLVWI